MTAWVPEIGDIITGAVCYSRQIDETLRSLVANQAASKWFYGKMFPGSEGSHDPSPG